MKRLLLIFVLPLVVSTVHSHDDNESRIKFWKEYYNPKVEVTSNEVPTIDRNQVVGTGLGSPQGAAATMESVPNIPDVVQGRKTADYTIQSGDTLSELANITGSTVEELMALNNIKNKLLLLRLLMKYIQINILLEKFKNGSKFWSHICSRYRNKK